MTTDIKPFAKLFETKEFGQILVIAERNDEGRPSIRFSIQPQGDALGICSLYLNYSDDESGWKTRDESFPEVDEARARQIAAQIFREVAPFNDAFGGDK